MGVITKATIENVDYFIRLFYENKIDVLPDGSVINRRTGRKANSLIKRNYLIFSYCGKSVSVHHLIYAIYIGKLIVGLVINHKDGNKHNNTVTNLELVTESENVRHAYRLGLNKTTEFAKQKSRERTIGEKNINSVFTDEQAAYIRIQYQSYKLNVEDIMNLYSVSSRAVRNLLRGISYTHVLPPGKPLHGTIMNKIDFLEKMVFNGSTISEISRKLNMDRSTVRKYIKKFGFTRNMERVLP